MSYNALLFTLVMFIASLVKAQTIRLPIDSASAKIIYRLNGPIKQGEDKNLLYDKCIEYMKKTKNATGFTYVNKEKRELSFEVTDEIFIGDYTPAPINLYYTISMNIAGDTIKGRVNNLQYQSKSFSTSDRYPGKRPAEEVYEQYMTKKDKGKSAGVYEMYIKKTSEKMNALVIFLHSGCLATDH